MVNEKGERSSEGTKGENEETGEEAAGKLSNSSRDFNTTTRVQERLKTLEARIKAVKSDFKTQVEGLRSRMEHLKTDLKTVHCNIDVNSKKVKNSDEASEILWRKHVLHCTCYRWTKIWLELMQRTKDCFSWTFKARKKKNQLMWICVMLQMRRKF